MVFCQGNAVTCCWQSQKMPNHPCPKALLLGRALPSPQTEVHSISFAAQLPDIDLPLHFLGLFLIAFLQRQGFILADKRTKKDILVGSTWIR